jgi:hypothetical protein
MLYIDPDDWRVLRQHSRRVLRILRPQRTESFRMLYIRRLQQLRFAAQQGIPELRLVLLVMIDQKRNLW